MPSRPSARSLLSARRSGPFSRRRFLGLGAAGAGTMLLGGCRGGAPAASGDAASGSGRLALSQFFGGPMLAAGEPARAPFGVIDAYGLLPSDKAPDVLEVQLVHPGGAHLGAPVRVERHDDGLPRGYYPLRFEVGEPGFYTARTEVTGEPAEMSFQVFDQADMVVVRPGQALPALETPTTEDPRGVTPICTRVPACPLHELALADALGQGRPLAVLVATPAFCPDAICGPVLELLAELVGARPDVVFLHLEVYVNPEVDTVATTEAMQGLGLHYERALFLAGRDGVVVERLDTIFDRRELSSALARI